MTKGEIGSVIVGEIIRHYKGQWTQYVEKMGNNRIPRKIMAYSLGSTNNGRRALVPQGNVGWIKSEAETDWKSIICIVEVGR